MNNLPTRQLAGTQIDKMSEVHSAGDERTEPKSRPTREPTARRREHLDQPKNEWFAKSDSSPLAVFVLEIDGEPILAFEAATFRQARELGKENWLQEDLKRMTIGYCPLWDGESPIGLRRAEPAEEAYYGDAIAEQAKGDLPFVYLVRLDDEADKSRPVTRGSFPPRRSKDRRTYAACREPVGVDKLSDISRAADTPDRGAPRHGERAPPRPQRTEIHSNNHQQ